MKKHKSHMAGGTGKIQAKGHSIKTHAKDNLAHESHHKMNKEHGTPNGFAPPDEGYQRECETREPHIGMHENESCCE